MSHNETIPLGSLTNREKEWKDEIHPSIEAYLDTKPTYGLTENQINERRHKFGRNELQEHQRNKIKHFLSFCKLHYQKTIGLLISYWGYCLSYGNIHYFNCCH